MVKWYRSGKEILADGTKIKALEFKGGYYQLVITAADENDASVYQVRATNSSGSISTTANLEVEGNDITVIIHYLIENPLSDIFSGVTSYIEILILITVVYNVFYLL